MQDLTVVNVLDGQSHLHEPVENLVFTVAHFAIFLFFRNQGVQVTTVGVVHDDAQTPLVHKGLLVRDDERVTEGLEHMHFVDCIFSLLAVHLGHVDDLHHVVLAVLDALHQDCKAEAALANDLYFSVLLHNQI